MCVIWVKRISETFDDDAGLAEEAGGAGKRVSCRTHDVTPMAVFRLR